MNLQLTIVGKEEDVPRVVSGYAAASTKLGKQLGMEVAVMIRPLTGECILVMVAPKKAAQVWRSGTTDVLKVPSETMANQAAEQHVRTMNRKDKGDPGPSRLRGEWKAFLEFNGEQPVVTLSRAVAAYGTLIVRSDADGWKLVFDRKEQWFAKADKRESERSYSHLADAISAGMKLMMGSVGEACTFRDTHRRATADPVYAEKHPPKAPVEPTNPVDAWKVRPGLHEIKEVPGIGWVVTDTAGTEKARFGSREKGKASKYASALNRGETPPEDAAPSTASSPQPPSENRSAPRRGKANKTVEVPPALSEIPAPQPPSCPTSTANIARATQAEAHAIGNLADSLWGETEGPELLRRAAKLIRHGQSLARSPLCTGANQQAAMQHIDKAAHAYNEARESIVRGDSPDVVATLRRVAEQVSLAAARAAKGCSQPDAPPPKTRTKPAEPRPSSPPARPAPKTIARKPADEEVYMEVPPKPANRSAPAEEIDPAKDAALMSAFEQAVRAAMSQAREGS